MLFARATRRDKRRESGLRFRRPTKNPKLRINWSAQSKRHCNHIQTFALGPYNTLMRFFSYLENLFQISKSRFRIAGQTSQKTPKEAWGHRGCSQITIIMAFLFLRINNWDFDFFPFFPSLNKKKRRGIFVLLAVKKSRTSKEIFEIRFRRKSNFI